MEDLSQEQLLINLQEKLEGATKIVSVLMGLAIADSGIITKEEKARLFELRDLANGTDAQQAKECH